MAATTPGDEPPEGIHHHTTASTVPLPIQKYFHQRHDIWSQYTEGIWMTDSAWYGITPEPVAIRIASDLASHYPASTSKKTILVDAFAGAGGNTIAFALSGRWKQIFAFESDPLVLKCAKHNAEVYGVAKKIFWVQGDVFKELPRRLKTLGKEVVVFGSPPWGGPTYTDYEVFDLAVMSPYPLSQLYRSFNAITSDFVLYLPRTSDLREIAKYAQPRDDGSKLKVVHYCMHGASKAICVYFGAGSGGGE